MVYGNRVNEESKGFDGVQMWFENEDMWRHYAYPKKMVSMGAFRGEFCQMMFYAV